MVQGMLHFIEKCPTCFHAVQTTAKILEENGFSRLQKIENLQPGGSYYTVRDGSSLIAFRIPKNKPVGFLLTASHGDSPCFRIRDNCDLDGNYARISAERYGGMLNAPWLDRPLSIAGRVMVKEGDTIKTRLVDFENPMALIPNVAIHMNREANKSLSYDTARDLFPLYGGKNASFRKDLAKKLGCLEQDILATDLFVYNPQKGLVWGAEDAFVSAPRLDDLACVYGCLQGLLLAEDPKAIAVMGLFDHEEIGSETKQGAASGFLAEVLDAICAALEVDGEEMRKNSMLLSCDNGHALHPNRPDLSDRTEAPVMNGGVVIKHSARYATDGVSCAVFSEICRRAGVPVQHYSNRPDQAGGSTLGNIANTKLGMTAVDIGMAQLAMHSCFETAGREDVSYLIRAIEAFYKTALTVNDDGVTMA